MDQLPNYQNVALGNGALPMNQPSSGPQRNHLKGNVSYVSARDRRLAEREAQRRDKISRDKQSKSDAYLDSLQADRSRPTPLPGFDPASKRQELGGALGRAVGLPSGANGGSQMNAALSRASEAKSRRDAAYEEKRRRHIAKKQQQQQQQSQQPQQPQQPQLYSNKKNIVDTQWLNDES